MVCFYQGRIMRIRGSIFRTGTISWHKSNPEHWFTGSLINLPHAYVLDTGTCMEICIFKITITYTSSFMDLTFQVPMQYCSLQNQILLPSPVTSTTECCFCFGSIPSFFLELFLHWSPVAYWAPTNLGSSSFSVLSFGLFILFCKKCALVPNLWLYKVKRIDLVKFYHTDFC